MNYTQLTEKNKAEIDILLKQGLSMRKVATILGISHSTVSRYKNKIYKKRQINIDDKYNIFINYLFTHYDKKTSSIDVCVQKFKKSHITHFSRIDEKKKGGFGVDGWGLGCGKCG